MKPGLTASALLGLLCLILGSMPLVAPGLVLRTLEAARHVCMESGELLMTALRLLGLRLVLAVTLPPALLASFAGFSTLLRTRELTAQLLGLRVQPLPHEIDQLSGALGIRRRLRLIELDAPIAFCAGLLTPRIFLSTGLLRRLSGEEFEAVLRHEAWHARHHDSLFSTLGLTARRVLFFLPAVRELIGRALATREIRADESAITAMGSPYPLASALYKALQWSKFSTESAPGAFSAIDARIDHLLGPGRPPSWRSPYRLAAGLLSIAALGLIICGIVAASSTAEILISSICSAC